MKSLIVGLLAVYPLIAIAQSGSVAVPSFDTGRPPEKKDEKKAATPPAKVPEKSVVVPLPSAPAPAPAAPAPVQSPKPTPSPAPAPAPAVPPAQPPVAPAPRPALTPVVPPPLPDARPAPSPTFTQPPATVPKGAPASQPTPTAPPPPTVNAPAPAQSCESSNLQRFLKTYYENNNFTENPQLYPRTNVQQALDQRWANMSQAIVGQCLVFGDMQGFMVGFNRLPVVKVSIERLIAPFVQKQPPPPVAVAPPPPVVTPAPPPPTPIAVAPPPAVVAPRTSNECSFDKLSKVVLKKYETFIYVDPVYPYGETDFQKWLKNPEDTIVKYWTELCMKFGLEIFSKIELNRDWPPVHVWSGAHATSNYGADKQRFLNQCKRLAEIDGIGPNTPYYDRVVMSDFQSKLEQIMWRALGRTEIGSGPAAGRLLVLALMEPNTRAATLELAQKACADERYGLGYLGVYAWAKFAAKGQLQALAQKQFDGCPSERLLARLKVFYEERGIKRLPGNAHLQPDFNTKWMEAQRNEKIAREISENWPIVYPKVKGLCNPSTDGFMSAMIIGDYKKMVDEIIIANFKRPNAQAVYFVDGTNSAFRQRNLLHQMSRWVKPSKATGDKVGYIRILSGISTFNGDGIQDLHALAAGQIISDIKALSVTQIYIVGFSRGAIMSLGLAKDLCGEGNALQKWHREGGLKEGRLLSVSKDELMRHEVCSKIKAVVLIDPVDTNLSGWTTSGANQLKSNTIRIFKKNQTEFFWGANLSTAPIYNIDHDVAIPDLNHGGMMCGAEGQGGAQASNLPLVLNTAANFLRARGLKIDINNALQDCRRSDGAWPPCIVVDGRREACGRNEDDRNWELGEW